MQRSSIARGAVPAVALALLLQDCSGIGSREAVQSPPKIVVDGAGYDFGVVDQGRAVSHSYTFRNAGGLDLTIASVHAACGCTAASAPATTIPPGAQGSIEAKFDTASACGRQARSISVYSNDPSQPVTTLTLTGEVSAAIAADPPQLYVGHLSRGQAAATDVRLRLNGAGDIVATAGTGNVIDAVVGDAAPGSAERRLRVAVRKDAPLGAFHDAVSIRSRSRGDSGTVIPVAGFVDGEVVVSPAQVIFGLVTPAGAASRVVAVRNRGQRPVHVTAARVPGTIGTAAVRLVRDGQEYRITVTLNPGLHAGRLDGVLEVDTDHPEQARISVPLSGRVAERSS